MIGIHSALRIRVTEKVMVTGAASCGERSSTVRVCDPYPKGKSSGS